MTQLGIQVEIANEQSLLEVDEMRLRDVAKTILRDAGVHGGSLSIAIVDDATIHVMNREYLQHDYPTDVLSFLLEEDLKEFEGQVVVSSETAIQNANEYGWRAEEELLLYVIHGTLHLAGYRDKTEADRAAMRQAEVQALRNCGVELPSSKHTARKGA